MDKDFRYFTAAETAKPGYLKRRFAAIRKSQREKEQSEKAALDAKVRKIGGR